jgi:hypothetical protein
VSDRKQPLLFQWWAQIVEDERLSAADGHIAFVVSRHMTLDGDGAFPSITTLAREAKRKRHTICASVKTLEELGYLTVKRGARRGTDGPIAEVNHYTAKCPKGHLPSVPSVQAQVPEGAQELPSSSNDGAAAEAAPPPSEVFEFIERVRQDKLKKAMGEEDAA